MSTLGNLKQEIDSLASDAKATAGSLSGFKSKFSNAITSVEGAIGGSAQRKDKEVIAALQSAQQQVDAAVAALQQAASTARSYAASL